MAQNNLSSSKTDNMSQAPDTVLRVFDLEKMERYATLAGYFKKNMTLFDSEKCYRMQRIAEAEQKKRCLSDDNSGIILTRADKKGEFEIFLRVMSLEKAQSLYAKKIQQALR